MHTFTVPLIPSLFVENGWILASDSVFLGQSSYRWCFLSSQAVLATCAVLLCMIKVRMPCICYTAGSLKSLKSQISSVLHSFVVVFTSPACVGMYPHSVCMCLWLQFRQPVWKTDFCVCSFIYLFQIAQDC